MDVCKECGKSTINPKFCSRSCAATFNNKNVTRHGDPNRSICPRCGGKKDKLAKSCSSCRSNQLFLSQGERTLDDIQVNGASKSKWTSVRALARRMMEESDIEKKCTICGFDVVVETCHIKDIAKFDLNTKVKIVNSLDNLVYLCPNHHAMFDRGLIELNSR